MYNEIIKKKFNELKNFEYIFRKKNKNIWDKFLDNLKFSPVAYSNQELDYQELVRNEGNIFDIDLSLMILFKKEAVVIISFTLAKIDEKYSLSSYGLPILPPLFKDDADHEIKNKLSILFYEMFLEFGLYYKIYNWISSEGFANKTKNSDWHIISEKKKDKIFLIKEGYINIAKTDEEIQRHLKKKKIFVDIKRASELWDSYIRYKMDWTKITDEVEMFTLNG